MPAQRFVLGIAYQAGRQDHITKGKDGARDFFTPAELEKACWSFGKSAQDIGIFHADGTLGHAQVVENFIHRGPDWPITDIVGNKVIVKAGDWVVGALLDDVGWDLTEKRHVTGWSPQGTGTRRTVRSNA